MRQGLKGRGLRCGGRGLRCPFREGVLRLRRGRMLLRGFGGREEGSGRKWVVCVFVGVWIFDGRER